MILPDSKIRYVRCYKINAYDVIWKNHAILINVQKATGAITLIFPCTDEPRELSCFKTRSEW